ncbi:GGDEF domain-containing protein [Aurantimonas sp. VKM B-3413]|uniref:GGDEF domain-containing protein n=1 Tax=Aurantimonas sp. VKM B-3413 TaxID=2779401 RepID=UPI001E3F7EA7|nr:GGDEF domain-containing protein [Aurantimonas sp. VKM B-3413]MCB8839048.1 GGDEF domain-containing protein [Aurantimonas sp. VKM B-3413]
MKVDVATIFFVLSGIAFVAALAVLAETRKLDRAPMAWWTIGFLCIGVGAGTAPLRLLPGLDWLAIGGSNLFLSAGFSFIICGVARFTRGRDPVLLALVAPLVWLAFWLFCPYFAAIEARIAVQSAIVASYSFIGARLLLTGVERTFFIRVLAGVFALHGFLYSLRVALLPVPGAVLDDHQMTGFAFTLAIFEAAIIVVAIAFLLIAVARERAESDLRQLAETDFLTGIGNRRAFEQNVTLALSDRQPEQSPSSIAVLDLDHFKRINDTFGHAYGDEILRLFCKTVRLKLGPADIFCRLGGEEFAVCLPDRSAADAALAADAIRRDFAERARIFRGKTADATVSIGISEIRSPRGLRESLSVADAALYGAKRSGRNRVQIAYPA